MLEGIWEEAITCQREFLFTNLISRLIKAKRLSQDCHLLAQIGTEDLLNTKRYYCMVYHDIWCAVAGMWIAALLPNLYSLRKRFTYLDNRHSFGVANSWRGNRLPIVTLLYLKIWSHWNSKYRTAIHDPAFSVTQTRACVDRPSFLIQFFLIPSRTWAEC
jgi:hypothetical protein